MQIIKMKKFQALKDNLKLTEEELLIKYRAIYSSINAIAISDLEGNLTYVNPSFLKMWGYSREKDVLGKSVLSFWEEKENAAEVIRALQNNGSFVCEIVAKKKDGLRFETELSANLINDPDGKPIFMMASFINATDRNKAEEKSHKSEIQCSSLFKNMLEGYTYCRMLFEKGKPKDFIYLEVNNKFEEMIGLKNVIGKKISEVIPGILKSNPKLIETYGRVVMKGIPVKFETYLSYIDMWFYVSAYCSEKEYFIAVFDDITKQKQSCLRLQKILDTTTKALSSIIEVKDPYTSGHQVRVAKLSAAIAEELKLDKKIISAINTAALLHDLGKIAIPAAILSKPSKLSDAEFEMLKEHPKIGFNVLKNVDYDYPIAKIILQHHERNNGSGYPAGLKGPDIMFESKIIAIADVVEAMSSHRPYRPALGIDEALKEIEDNKGVLYDEDAANACIKLFKSKRFEF